MDSRLIAGAYSQHFRALEREEHQENERKDSITRAKRLSQETNKRRKFQAQKRKLDAQREERRRQDILTKRREEQKKATEKYQRSHIPSGSRQNSGRSSPKRSSPRRHLVPGLEDALKLIRRSPHGEWPHSGRDHHLSFNNENENPMDRAYFYQVSHHVTRPSSAKAAQSMKYEATAQLMDYSMKNLTSSKSLFEQQLEHQQSLLLEQQHKSLKEFNDAVQKELNSSENGQGNEGLERDPSDGGLSDSCSSVDSLEKSHGSDQRVTNMPSQENSQEPSNILPNSRASNNNEHFYLNQNSSNNQNLNKVATLQESNHIPLNIDLTPSATFQKTPHYFEPQVFSLHAAQANTGDKNSTHSSKDTQMHNRGQLENITQKVHQETIPPFQLPLKQILTDSIAESESSDSSISLVKIPDNNDKNVSTIQQTISPNQKVIPGHQSKVDHPQGYSLSNKEVNKNDSKSENKEVLRQDSKSASQGQNAWASNVSIPPASNQTKADPIIETYNPRYASAIGLSIWPGQLHTSSSTAVSEAAICSVPNSSPVTNNAVNNNSNFKSSSASKDITSTVSERPVSSIMPSSHIAAPIKDDKRLQLNQADSANLQGPLPSPVSSSSSSSLMANNFNIVKNECMPAFNQQDFNYPFPQTSIQGLISQNSIIPPSQASVYNNLQAEISQLSQQMVHYNQSRVASSPQFSPTHPTSNISHDKGGHSPLTHGTGAVPVPAVRTIFPVNRPPVPATKVGFNMADEAGKKTLSNERFNSHKDQQEMSQERESNVVTETSEEEQEKGADKENDLSLETSKPLKGILKQLPPKVAPHGQSAGKVQARDSVELARLQNEKRARKKSVRFAEHHIEENFEEYDDSDTAPAAPQFTVKNSYKPSMIRPASAKVISNSAKLDLSVKQARASSAGARRPHPSTFSQVGSVQHTSTILPDNSNIKINLPANISQPLNTSAPINRPKAAAHIIMSSESQNILKAATQNSNSDAANSNAATVHKSQLEAKVKTVNNNFMSKVPVKAAPKVVSSPMVYHVMRPSTNVSVGVAGGQVVSEDGALQDPNAQVSKDPISQITQPDRSRIRDPMAKKVPISNSTVTRTSIVPASTKINYPMSNGNVPSYSVSNAQGSSVPVFDENGLRIDRTPTDEEITWLWDKVRNCLDKEEDKVVARQLPSNGTEPPGRPTPVLSTKLIDGASLGFNSSGAAGLRPGSGYFYPRANSANASSGQNKAKPIVQQQGSYLRRYGLLQQRRTHSASATGQRGGSAGFVKYSTVPTPQQSQQQILQTDMPTPMALSYRPQDHVTESTAAFVMAERLVKQSLSDSHIALGMDDAQVKQELHNKAAKVVSRGGGPSALSLEEQKLMESLDKLNDRLKVTDQKYPGTIHFHQPYQPHLPGFRGHQGLNDSRRPGMPQTIPPRSQSARIRQQIRQYR